MIRKIRRLFYFAVLLFGALCFIVRACPAQAAPDVIREPEPIVLKTNAVSSDGQYMAVIALNDYFSSPGALTFDADAALANGALECAVSDGRLTVTGCKTCATAVSVLALDIESGEETTLLFPVFVSDGRETQQLLPAAVGLTALAVVLILFKVLILPAVRRICKG